MSRGALHRFITDAGPLLVADGAGAQGQFLRGHFMDRRSSALLAAGTSDLDLDSAAVLEVELAGSR
jgi:hypothetical protein